MVDLIIASKSTTNVSFGREETNKCSKLMRDESALEIWALLYIFVVLIHVISNSTIFLAPTSGKKPPFLLQTLSRITSIEKNLQKFWSQTLPIGVTTLAFVQG